MSWWFPNSPKLITFQAFRFWGSADSFKKRTALGICRPGGGPLGSMNTALVTLRKSTSHQSGSLPVPAPKFTNLPVITWEKMGKHGWNPSIDLNGDFHWDLGFFMVKWISMKLVINNGMNMDYPPVIKRGNHKSTIFFKGFSNCKPTICFESLQVPRLITRGYTQQKRFAYPLVM